MANGSIRKSPSSGNNIQTLSGANFRLVRRNGIVQISAAIGFWWADSSDGYVLKWASSTSGTPTQITLDTAMRPFSNIELWDVNRKKRVTVQTDGTLITNEALSGEALRFTGVWLAADTL